MSLHCQQTRWRTGGPCHRSTSSTLLGYTDDSAAVWLSIQHVLSRDPCVWVPLHDLCASCVVQAGSLQRITTRSPLWAPLPYELPLPSFSSLVITCSSFESGKRDTIGRLVVLLGAKYEDCLKRGATHLVVPQLGSVEGEPGYGSDSLIKKCQRAVAWKMCLVTPSWLVECAAAGQRLDEAEFFPPGELPAAATQGGALPSQLPVTQVRCCLHALARTWEAAGTVARLGSIE